MKRLCCSKILFIFIFFATVAFGALDSKSAILFYGKDISYPLAGIHNYIIVQPDNTDVYQHGFSVYKKNIYAYVSIGEVDKDSSYFNQINKKWVLGSNKAWNSQVLDITNKAYQKFLFTKVIEPLVKKGFQNFFFDTLDSYMLVDKTPAAQKKSQAALADFINEFHHRFAYSKLIVNRGFHIIDKIHTAVTAVLFESYYHGYNGGKYTQVSAKDRAWLDLYIKKIKSYRLPIIDVEYLPQNEMSKAKAIVQKVEDKGMIPYVTNGDLTDYGVSSVNPVKREILFLTDMDMENWFNDDAHLVGALPLEYLGYIQKLYNINKGLPKLASLSRYGGVVVWLKHDYKRPQQLINWLKKVEKRGIKIVFANSFGFPESNPFLNQFGIKAIETPNDFTNKKKIIKQTKMIGFEMPPSAGTASTYLQPENADAQLTYEDSHGLTSTPVAITSWGGYSINNAFLTYYNDNAIWVTNPFSFFARALRLKPLLVPDPTTENGLRLLFSHEDGDGSMNRIEWDTKLFSIDGIYRYVLKKFDIPFSISVVGAEIDKNGLYPKESKALRHVAKESYALPNVEAATHTFSHPFAWEEITKNGDLAPKYRLAPKGYKFNLDYEILGQLKDINENLEPAGKHTRTLFWSGDCRPSYKVLKFVYRHHLLNINGGDTTITNIHPWLSAIAPFGIGKGGYYQIYTGAQNEDVYTNLWRGPFWGYKRVVQTFKLTNSPRRFKPIDIYFHFYTASKRASLNALIYVIRWAMRQPVMPIFTSQYIPKAMDFYTVSIANENNKWLISGMRSLHTLRIEKPDAHVNFALSKGVMGIQHFQNHTYIALDNNQTQLITLSTQADKNAAYLVSANAPVTHYSRGDNTQHFVFSGYVPLKIELHMPRNCHIRILPKPEYKKWQKERLSLRYDTKKGATLDVFCK